MERDYYFLAFDSTHAALSAERALEKRVSVRVMPTLRQVSAGCGISLRVETADYPALKRALSRGALQDDACRLYHVEGERVNEMEGEHKT
ncbi:MAG: DUF3343 domain-containing protein [Clostridia bacterium]|nr:DUF3343 domain-containing protein [Clostridia bacterium]